MREERAAATRECGIAKADDGAEAQAGAEGSEGVEQCRANEGTAENSQASE